MEKSGISFFCKLSTTPELIFLCQTLLHLPLQITENIYCLYSARAKQQIVKHYEQTMLTHIPLETAFALGNNTRKKETNNMKSTRPTPTPMRMLPTATIFLHLLWCLRWVCWGLRWVLWGSVRSRRVFGISKA